MLARPASQRGHERSKEGARQARVVMVYADSRALRACWRDRRVAPTRQLYINDDEDPELGSAKAGHGKLPVGSMIRTNRLAQKLYVAAQAASIITSSFCPMLFVADWRANLEDRNMVPCAMLLRPLLDSLLCLPLADCVRRRSLLRGVGGQQLAPSRRSCTSK